MPETEQKKSRTTVTKFKMWLANTEIKIALKTGIAASLSLIVGLAFAKAFQRPDSIVSGLWSVLASIVVMQAYLGGTYRAAWVRFLGVLVGSIAGAIFITYVGHDALSLGLSVFSTILICALLNIKESFRIASLSTAVIVVLAGLKPDVTPWVFSLYRFIDSCIGILVAVFVAHVIWPERAVENLRNNIARILALLSKYYRLAVNFEGENEADLPSAEALHVEIASLLEDNHIYREEAKLELLNKEFKETDLNLVTNQLEEIFGLTASLRSVNKESLAKIFDDSLAKAINDVIDKTDLTFQRLEKEFSLEKPSENAPELENALLTLDKELLRFRDTRTTRKFNLQDVESFYVFFHDLRSIGESVKKIICQ